VINVRLWGNYVSDPNDYWTSNHALANVRRNHDAGEVQKDRDGYVHVVRPDKPRVAVELMLSIPSRLCERLSNSAAATPMRLAQWLEVNVCDNNYQLTVYVSKTATDGDGEDFAEKRWYTCEVLSLPDWLEGTRAGLLPAQPMPAMLEIPCVVTAAGHLVDFDEKPSKVWSITGVDVDDETFTISGDWTEAFVAGTKFLVSGSTDNDGWWTVASSEHTGGNTVITVTGDIDDATVDGSIYNAGEVDRE